MIGMTLNPAQFLGAMHPNLREYNDGGGYRSGDRGDGSGNLIGFVPTHLLASMHGNPTDREGIDHYKTELQSGRGFTDPVMVEYDPKNGYAVLGEGNHRVEAARELGISHVPARVHRSRISDNDLDYMARKGGHPKQIGALPSRHSDGSGNPYYPPDMHPSWIWGTQVL